ncbi:uncharacterized protein JCM15063_002877 [Sporobolomyces koalae]|uniref:uncharacterized protein n=1 Tax=Sporobolomyces koalae TaxID=500713 RepID=UPI00316C9850
MQLVASASAVASRSSAGEVHRRTPSITSPPPSGAVPGTQAPAVRLPPVQIPREDFLPAAFNPERRQSINSDPFLHAFSATSDPAHLRRPSIDADLLLDGVARARGPSGGLGATGQMGVTIRPNNEPPSSASEHMPPPQPFDSHYQFGSPFASGSHPDHGQHAAPFPGPASTYRFGGPPIPPATAAPLDAPPYFGYTMRRQPPSRGQGSTPGPYPTHNGGAGGFAIPSPLQSTKRKSSGDTGDSSYPDAPYYSAQTHRTSSMNSDGPPDSKRRASSLAADKVNNLDLNDPHRRESFSPTWEDRRDSNESYRSSGSQHNYAMYNHAQNPSHAPPGPPPASSSAHSQQPGPFMRLAPNANYYDDQVGPRGSIARGMYEPEVQNFGRRPSIPGVSQMMQGQTPFYSGQPPNPAPAPGQPPTYAIGPPQPSSSSGSLSHPSVTVSSAPPAPSSRPSQDGHAPAAATAAGSGARMYPVGPPPQWPSSAEPTPSHGGRQDSAGSLDPLANLKDSPYSRSPELRVSHKLAERKRRKEMAQLFDDLREALPLDRGVKSSKWEILTKAVEFIGQLKTFNRDLQNDNQNLRLHLNLPQSQPPQRDSRSNSGSNAPPPPPPPHQAVAPPPGGQPLSMPNMPAQGPSQGNPFPPFNHNGSFEHPHPHHHPQQHSEVPRPHVSRTGSHASSHASSLSMET